MREQFEQHGRDARHARLVVGAVPQPAPVPRRLPRAPDVRDDLGHHQVGQVARTVAVGTAVEAAALLTGVEDAQRADRLVAVAHPGIGVEGQGQVDRDAQPRGVGHPFGSARQRIDPVGTRHVVVLVVVGEVLGRIDRGVEPGPLQPVARPLAEAGIAARLLGIERIRLPERVADRAGHVAVAAADLHGIGRNGAAGHARTVGERDDRLLAGRKGEAPR